MAENNVLKPSVGILIKLGSIAVHVEEALSPKGHGYDVVVLKALLSDPELAEWRKGMDKLALLPLKR